MDTSKQRTFLWSLPQPIFVLTLTILTASACVSGWIKPWSLVGWVTWLSFPFFLLLERIIPKRKDWFLNKYDLAIDAFWVLATYLFWIPLYARHYDSHIEHIFSAIREPLGITFRFEANTISGLILMAFCCLLAREFIGYWAHRVQHRFLFLWRIHATHHHITKMSVCRTDRTHPLEFIGLNLGSAVVMPLLGASSDVVAVMIMFVLTTVHINHCNLPLTAGVYGKVFTTPEWHQVHHSLNYQESNTNYGCVLIIWDRIFGTFSNKQNITQVGNGSGKKLSLWTQLILPLLSNNSIKKL
ncbi:sterol desaturase family protein [Paraglaciecola sp.]|uniref:sterol desaturase family protein n=1 Tax=Paraglaciecola sp. TaxID=1920173 RepID=UPI003EF5AE27